MHRRQFGDPILREKSQQVPEDLRESEHFRGLVKQMFFTMRRVGGVGLAAPQIGESLCFAVVGVRKNSLRPLVAPIPYTVVINPEIIEVFGGKANDWEGCLSLPRIRGEVPRHREIVVKYTDQLGKEQVVRLKGFHARIFQHEIDHLNGVLYVDRMMDMLTLMTEQEFKKHVAINGLETR